jgi:hypothetical protein
MNEGTDPGRDTSSDTQPIETPATPPPSDMPAAPEAQPGPDAQAAPPPMPADPAPVAPPAAPPIAPPVAAPAAPVSWSSTTPGTVVAARGGRTTLSAVAGVAMLVLGIIGALIGIGVIVFGGVVGNLDLTQFPGAESLTSNEIDIVGGVFIFAGIVVLVYSAFYIVGGIGVLRSREWGRVIGIVVGIISGLVWLAGVSGDRGSVAFALILLLIHVYIVVVLAVRFRERVAAG